MAWGVVFQRGVAALRVVVFDVSGDRRACGGEVLKAVLPGALLFEGADEPLTQPVLHGRVGSDLFLFQTVVAHKSAVGPRAEDQSVVVSQGKACGSATGGAKAMQQCLLQSPSGSTSEMLRH